MTRRSRRHAGRTTVIGALCVLAAACGSSDDPPAEPEAAPTATGSSVPPAFAPACGRPGAVVTVDPADLPVTIAHAACDLRGVTVRTGSGSDVVPGGEAPPETVCDAPTGCPSISVNAKTMDVTIT